jgi:two-component sensor histidine kinase
MKQPSVCFRPIADICNKAQARNVKPQDSPWRIAGQYARSIAVGVIAAGLAVLLRYSFGLSPLILPFFTVVIAVCIVTVFVGFVGGLATMLAGGVLSWYFILAQQSWALEGAAPYSLVGYFAVTSVILGTSLLYRRSEQRAQAAALSMALQEAENQRLFAREMSHRLKNAMAIVQAMASQTFERGSLEAIKFDGRIKALADAQNLLNEQVRKPTASVRRLVETATDPFNDRVDRFQLVGEPVILADQKAISLALALHELGTNAVKHGALSDARGWVSINWSDTNRRFQLDWKEHDGPPVSAPLSGGFGSRLLARTAMGADVRFERDGLRCTISHEH